MKNGVICNIPVTEGEITIVQAAFAGDIMKHSCEVAMASRTAGAGVLVINTGLSKRRFKEAAISAGIQWSQDRDTNTIVSPGKTPLIIQTSIAGDLSNSLGKIRSICEEADIKVVVITGWEWTSSNYVRKERLLYGLRTLLDELDIALIVYSQSPAKIRAGEYSRGGVGKLAMLAYRVNTYNHLQEIEGVKTDLTEFGFGRNTTTGLGNSEQLEPNKINTLPTIFAGGGSARSLPKHQEEERVLALAA